MCGFAGYIRDSLRDNDTDILKKMTDLIAHRGPDDASAYIDEGACLGFRRLSIIDLEAGRQPMKNEDSTLVLTFNGEIYNFQSLREDLKARGHVFATGADSEVLLHGYEEYGEELPARLRGMFAFVIWDTKNKKLFGARDIFGIKPFYYYKNGSSFFWGSEIKSFLAHPDFCKEFDESLLPTWLCYEYIPCEKTFFKNVFKLPGAHSFTYQNGVMEIQKYYDIRFDIREGRTMDDWAADIRRVFAESVRAHRIADVEVGCFLSSGVDSSLVANEVSVSASPMEGVTDPVKTFSVGFAEENVSELADAAEFARAVNLPNIQNRITADDFFSATSAIQYMMDEPLPNPSQVPLYFLCENAAKYVKVVLSGEGADELFGGYPMYLAEWHQARFARRVPRAVRRLMGKAAARFSFKGSHFLAESAKTPLERYPRANYNYTRESRWDILKEKTDAPDPLTFSAPYFARAEREGWDSPTATQYADIFVWMAYDILQKADRMSMAHSLELRVPFLDREVLALAMQLPQSMRAFDTTTKAALRASAAHLPKKTATMKKKGFATPLDAWLREEKFYNEVYGKLTGEIAEKFFKTDVLKRLMEEHKKGAHNMKKIYLIYSFVVWYEEFFVKR
ncbi:MAG: asparagine synthase (glutamine-hydrolyzing) [Clostridia bacterium]|nr:asparagine synthase (glutamine-hydrolyzing) [Clostridia bacterium]